MPPLEAQDTSAEAVVACLRLLAAHGRALREAEEAGDPDPEDLVTVPRPADPGDGEGAAA